MDNCVREAEFAERLATVESRSKSNTKRLDDVEKKQEEQTDLISSVKLLADRMERTTDDVKEIKSDVKELKEKPQKRIDGIVDKLLWLIVGAVAAAVLTKVGIVV